MRQELVRPEESPAVKAIDAKLSPLWSQRHELEARVTRWSGAAPGTRERLEGDIHLPQARADLARLAMQVDELDQERARVLDAERGKVRAEIDRRIREKVLELRPLVERMASANAELHHLEELKEQLGGRQIYDRYAFWEFLPESRTVETLLGRWIRLVRERFAI